MTLATTTVLGFALLRCLAGLRRWRPLCLRFAEEHAAIDGWLAALARALPQHAGHAAALAELPRLRKGYSDTFERGRVRSSNWAKRPTTTTWRATASPR